LSIPYTVSKTKWKDTETTRRPIESQLKYMKIYMYSLEYITDSSVTEILEDEIYITCISDKTVKRFKKAEILYLEYEFDNTMIVDDFM
jgi:hypothetical protein